MVNFSTQFAEASGSAGGIGAFNINLKGFLFQLITFVIILLALQKWVFPKLTATLEARRKAVEESLSKAKQVEEALAKAEEKSAHVMGAARAEADKVLADANAAAKEIVAKAETAANLQAERLTNEAKARLEQERLRLHEQLKDELADLVVLTTEKVLRAKLNEREERRLIEASLREIR